jgi:hypothetical protein
VKYFLVIGSGAVAIGLLLSLLVDYFFGDWASAFFIKFAAVPIGLVVSLFFFLVYDQLWPLKKKPAAKSDAIVKEET